MQKIIELTSQDFMRGISISGHIPGTGLFSEASGVNPFIHNNTSQYQTGLLQASVAPTEIQGAVVDDEIIDAAWIGSAYTGYLSGDDGNLYTLGTDSYGTPTEIQTGITNITDGLELFTPAGGNNILHVWQQTQIGTYNTSTTSWTANSYTGLTSSPVHPTHQFLGSIYFGDGYFISRLYDSGGTISQSSQELDIPSQYRIVTVNDDGYYLVFGATTNTVSGNNQVNTANKIFFWDTYSSSWNKEYTLDVAWIGSIQRVGEIMYAITSDGIYAFTFNMKPTLILPLSNADTLARVGGVSPTHNLATVKNNVLYWASGTPDICAYGSPMPGMSPRFFRPYQSIGTVPTFLAYPDKFMMVMAGVTGKFAKLSTVDSTTSVSNVTAETIYIPLERKWDIKRIEVVLGEPLASGDELNIDLQSDEDTAATDWGTFSYATHDPNATGTVRSHLMTGSFQAENLKIIINFVSGRVKIKKIMVYGEPVTIS